MAVHPDDSFYYGSQVPGPHIDHSQTSPYHTTYRSTPGEVPIGDELSMLKSTVNEYNRKFVERESKKVIKHIRKIVSNDKLLKRKAANGKDHISFSIRLSKHHSKQKPKENAFQKHLHRELDEELTPRNLKYSIMYATKDRDKLFVGGMIAMTIAMPLFLPFLIFSADRYNRVYVNGQITW